jgi:pimeloyl-ACP methyl ester carboxylesterase
MASRLDRPVAKARAGESAGIPPIWKETLWPVDWWFLRLSPVYYGLGVPRGDGSPVVVVPGFLGTDAYLYELYLWLRRIGYVPYMSGIGLNVECPGRLSARLLKTLERAHAETGKPVRVIGHSLGGILGRQASMQAPHLVSQLIYLGSPVQGVHAHPAIVAAVAALRATLSALSLEPVDCLTENCACGFLQNLTKPLPGSINHSAIYTRADGVVDWHDAQESDPALNHEVGGTHIGLVYNARAYRVLAQLLAYPPLDRLFL